MKMTRRFTGSSVEIGGKTYAVGVLEDGTLTEMNLSVDDEEAPVRPLPGRRPGNGSERGVW